MNSSSTSSTNVHLVHLFLFAVWLCLAVSCGKTNNQTAASAPSTPPQPHRIVSVTLASDEILLELVDPSRIAALSAFADDPRYSNIAGTDKAKAVKARVEGSAEQILALNPDLVFYATYNRPEFVKLIEGAGVAAKQIGGADTFEQIFNDILQIGRRVGAEAKAQQLIRQCRQRLDAVRLTVHSQPRPTVLYYDHGWVAGRQTIIDQIVTTGGGENYAASKGISGNQKIAAEVLLTWSPDVLLIVGDAKEPAVMPREEIAAHYPELAGLPAVQNQRAYEVPARIFGSVSQYVVQAPEMLAEILHEKK